MKKLILVSTIAISMLVFACKPKSERITGKWTVSECSITNLEELKKNQLMGIPDSLYAEYKTRLEGKVTGFIEDAKKEVFTFGKDSFDILRGSATHDKGVWKVSSDSKMLFLIPNESPAVEAMDIVSITGQEIKLSKKITLESAAIYVLKKQ